MIIFHLCPDRYILQENNNNNMRAPWRKSSSTLVESSNTHTHTPGRWRRRKKTMELHSEAKESVFIFFSIWEFFIPFHCKSCSPPPLSLVCDVDFSWGIPRPDKVERVSR
jgi:hypothetical protein